MGVRQRAVGRRDIPFAPLREDVAADPASPGSGPRTLSRCWCGAEDLEPLGSDYLRCRDCGTVVYRFPVDAGGDDSGFYGDRYWRRHVPEVLGLPGLEERARSDLPERAVFQLVKILEYAAPGGRVLELGCGAGSLAYLLCQAGFDAEGLELGPAAVELARGHFGLEVHHGPLESQDDPGPWDAIVAVDVLEHLPDPLATMTLCARRLAAGGRLFLQTPCYRQEGAEWQMLLPREHLHLFTEASVERLLRAAGFTAIEVGPSLFPHDMWVVAAAEATLVERPEPLAGVAPMAVALIDAYADGTRTRDERDAVDADRQRKQQEFDTLRQELESVRADQTAKARLLHRQDRELRALGVRLETELEAVRRDRQAKEELIADLGSELERTRQDQADKGRLIDRLTSELESVRGDQSAKAELVDRVSAELETVRADQQAKEIVIRQLDEDLRKATAELEEIHADRRYRLLQAAGVHLGGRR